MTGQEAFALATQHHEAGRLKEAETLYRQILAVEPNHADAMHHLGVLAIQAGNCELAIEWIQRALALNPNDAVALSNLGEACRRLDRTDEAIVAYRRSLELQPGSPETHTNLGLALARRGLLDQAVAAYRRALELRSDYSAALNSLGSALRELGQWQEAANAQRRALQIQPNQPEIHFNLGTVLMDGGQLDEAVAAHQRALQLKPHFSEAHLNLGNALKECGQLDEALAAYRRAMQCAPENDRPHSNFLYALHFHPGYDPATIAAEHRLWQKRFAEPLRKFHQSHANDRDPDRRLRIGYVSADFRRHPVWHFLQPLLENHDKARVEIYCYASVNRPDEATDRAKNSAHVWRDVLSLDDQTLAARIREDRIDILVDLTQHMSHNRLLTFARKPAPVQVSWLGYPASTGLASIDYRITDRWMEPEGSAWSESVETPIRLPDSWFCFQPVDCPESNPTPLASASAPITFGCLNNFCKVNDTVLGVWAAVLGSVENSRLLLHCRSSSAQNRLREFFQSRGIGPHRLDLVPWTANYVEYLGLFQRMDICLDPFPYNGGTTTCEALWMGVPVVSLAGHTAVSRLGLSILSTIGMPEWVASSTDDYVEIATRLAGDRPRLAEFGQTLRAWMKASPLMDAPRFARNLESAFRTMWERWCLEQHPA